MMVVAAAGGTVFGGDVDVEFFARFGENDVGDFGVLQEECLGMKWG